jgi:Ni/Fe-hydrogenase subunit HybB-like protein
VISGLALVIMLTIMMRWGYGLHSVITEYHLNALGKIMLTGSVMLIYSYVWEAWGPFYGSEVAERTMFLERVFGLYGWLYWTHLVLNALIPQLLWLPWVRRRPLPLFLISAGIIVGMWIERFIIVVTSLHRNYMPSMWGDFYPTFWDWATLAGSIGIFLMLFFLIIRFLPIVSIAEVREIMHKEKGR